jgi:hypothetical protein
VPEFISEDDLSTFEGWLRYQAVDIATTPPGELAVSRRRRRVIAENRAGPGVRLRRARNDRGAMPRGSRAHGLDPPPSRRRRTFPLWFIAAFEDCKATPDFLAGYEIDLRAALESAGVEFIAETGGGPGAGLRKAR